MEYEIVVDNSKVEATLAKLNGLLLSWPEAMLAVGRAFKQYYSTKPFVSRGSIFGKVWPDLKPSYAAWKAKKFPGTPILVRSGDLSKGFDFLSASNEVRLFNTVDYFKKHQEGDGVPQRISMALNLELQTMAQDIMAKDLQRKVNSL